LTTVNTLSTEEKSNLILYLCFMCPSQIPIYDGHRKEKLKIKYF